MRRNCINSNTRPALLRELYPAPSSKGQQPGTTGRSGRLQRALAGVPQWCHISSSGISGQENEFLFLWEAHEYLARRKCFCGLVCRREPQLRHQLFRCLVPVPHGCTVYRRYLLLIPTAPAHAGVAEGTSIPLLGDTLAASIPGKGSQPYSGGDPSTLCTRARALAVAKEENATAAGAVHVSSHPGGSSRARSRQQLLTKASPAVLPHWDPQAVITGCPFLWLLQLFYTSSPTSPFLHQLDNYPPQRKADQPAAGLPAGSTFTAQKGSHE